MESYNLIITNVALLADLTIRLLLSLRVVMRKKEASVTLAWLIVILLIPFVGAVIYLVLGENRLGQKRAEHAARSLPVFKRWIESLERHTAGERGENDNPWSQLELQAARVIGLPALPGNSLELIGSADHFFPRLIQDIDRAEKCCNLEFYIWEEGGQADEVAEALIRASQRGVRCRVLLDSIGSNEFLGSQTARRMREKGVEILEALPAGLLRALFVRIDLRNHRKIVVIDGLAAYTGSQNMVDPRYFKQDEGYGEWIDTMVRVRGPVVEAINAAFLYDWFVEKEEDPLPSGIFDEVTHCAPGGKTLVQLVPSGPGYESEGIHDLLLTTIYTAREELVLTSPYFVPDYAILAALKAAARRGVEVTVIVPEKVDSRLVQFASRARYSELSRSGVRIMVYSEGLLHAKTITVDRELSLIGSVNLDMRSFRLNFELTLFVYEEEFTRRLRDLQQGYLQHSRPLDTARFSRRPFLTRFKENCALILSPLL